jgi:hypothetical protein
MRSRSRMRSPPDVDQDPKASKKTQTDCPTPSAPSAHHQPVGPGLRGGPESGGDGPPRDSGPRGGPESGGDGPPRDSGPRGGPESGGDGPPRDSGPRGGPESGGDGPPRDSGPCRHHRCRGRARGRRVRRVVLHDAACPSRKPSRIPWGPRPRPRSSIEAEIRGRDRDPRSRSRPPARSRSTSRSGPWSSASKGEGGGESPERCIQLKANS